MPLSPPKSVSSEPDLPLSPSILATPKRAPLRWIHEHLAETSSTMEALRHHQLAAGECRLISADFQHAGRGQRGNHWESAPRENLCFSFCFQPQHIAAKAQFRLSQLVALAALWALRSAAPSLASRFTIKWPNDLYFDHSKIGGMLLEHSLGGAWVSNTLVGLGLNVNQAAFLSSAPNPISLRQILGQRYSRAELLEDFIAHFDLFYAQLLAGNALLLNRNYHNALYRRSGRHHYRDNATGELFEAELIGVLPQGQLCLRTSEEELRSYAFKEVGFIMD